MKHNKRLFLLFIALTLGHMNTIVTMNRTMQEEEEEEERLMPPLIDDINLAELLNILTFKEDVALEYIAQIDQIWDMEWADSYTKLVVSLEYLQKRDKENCFWSKEAPLALQKGILHLTKKVGSIEDILHLFNRSMETLSEAIMVKDDDKKLHAIGCIAILLCSRGTITQQTVESFFNNFHHISQDFFRNSLRRPQEFLKNFTPQYPISNVHELHPDLLLTLLEFQKLTNFIFIDILQTFKEAFLKKNIKMVLFLITHGIVPIEQPFLHVLNNNSAALKDSLATKDIINQEDPLTGLTLLEFAFMLDNPKLIELLFSQGAFITQNSLHVSAHFGSTQAMNFIFEVNDLFLSEQQLDVNVPCNLAYMPHWTPLDLALSEGHIEIAKTLLQRGASISSISLPFAFILRDEKLIELMTQHPDFDSILAQFKEEVIFKGYTALHLCAHHNLTNPLSYLITKGAPLNSRTHPHANTPLHLAIYTRSYKSVQALLEAGASMELLNANKETPLDVAKNALFNAQSFKERKVINKIIRLLRLINNPPLKKHKNELTIG